MKTLMNLTVSLCITLSLVAASGLLLSTNAQSHQQETELMQGLWGVEKQSLITEYMNLSEQEAQAFWPVYDEYASQRKEIGAERIDIIMEYAAHYPNLSDQKATQLTNAVFKNNMKLEKLQKQYYRKLSKAINPVRAAEFMQMEKYLDATLRREVQRNIPFLGELEKHS